MQLEALFGRLWEEYICVAPQAGAIHQAFLARGELVVNDHVALRTFDQAPISLVCLERHLLERGYRRLEPYRFQQKKLRAFGYVHPHAPRVFLSELLTGGFSPRLRAIVSACCAAVPLDAAADPRILFAGRLWPPVAWEDYQVLRQESDYAAWVAALGLRANHFTISVNALQHFTEVAEVVDFVESLGFPINEEGGRIKGGPAVLLEQASTLADPVEVPFAGNACQSVPGCYYEFARRYPDADGQLYQGFVTASADRIFESTDTRS